MTKIETIKEEFLKKWNSAGNVRRNSEPIWKWFESKLLTAFDEGYKKGVKDEIECVETSGEHLDLQKKLKPIKKH